MELYNLYALVPVRSGPKPLLLLPRLVLYMKTCSLVQYRMGKKEKEKSMVQGTCTTREKTLTTI